MCRFSCPVSEAARSETVTPWGKMTMLALTSAAGHPPADPEEARALYACTGCLRCRDACDHGNDVPSALYAGRAVAVRAGVAPAAAAGVGEQFAAYGTIERGERGEQGEPGELAAAAAALTPLASRAAGAPILFAGCGALAHEPSAVADALRAARALNAPLALHAQAPLCCGLPLLEAGFDEAFRAQARRVAAAVLDQAWDGATREVVVLEPQCAEAMTAHYRRAGVDAPAKVTTLTSYLAQRLDAAPARPRLPGAAVYHDACALARGQGETEAPRALLRAALRGGVVEGPGTGTDSLCCGAGGLVPRTMPDLAGAMAQRAAASLPPAEVLATASGACRRHFERSGVTAADVVSLFAKWACGGTDA